MDCPWKFNRGAAQHRLLRRERATGAAAPFFLVLISAAMVPAKSLAQFSLPDVEPWRGPAAVVCSSEPSPPGTQPPGHPPPPQPARSFALELAKARGQDLVTAEEAAAGHITRLLERLPDSDQDNGHLSFVDHYSAFRNAAWAQIFSKPDFQHIWTWRPTPLEMPARLELTELLRKHLTAEGCTSGHVVQLVLAENRGSLFTYRFAAGWVPQMLKDPLFESLFFTHMFLLRYSFSEAEAMEGALFLFERERLSEDGDEIARKLRSIGPLLNGPVRVRTLDVNLSLLPDGDFAFVQEGSDPGLILYPIQGFYTTYRLRFRNNTGQTVTLRYKTRRGDAAFERLSPDQAYTAGFAAVELPFVADLFDKNEDLIARAKVQFFPH